MSERHVDLSSQILHRSSASESSPYANDGSGSRRNKSRKRSRDDIAEDQAKAPRKFARLDDDHHSEREEPQQPSNHEANTSNPLQEQEFVDGPGRIVFIDERGKRCPAICFNKALLCTFTQIAEDSREIRDRIGAIQKAKLELEKIESSVQSDDLREAKIKVEEAMKIQKDIEAGISELVEARQRCDSLAQEDKWSQLRLENGREVARFVIEQILNTENLLNIPKPKAQGPVEVKNNASAKPAPMAVPEKTADDTQEPNVPDRSPATSTTGLHSPNSTDERSTPRQLALRHLRWAAEELDYRKGQFDLMQEEYGQAAAADRMHHQRQHPDRRVSTTQTDVDLRGLQKKRLFTRKVIEAEEAYDRAEQHAEDLGLGDILADPHAYYWGENYNEFSPRPTPESPSMFPVDRPRIESWMAAVPDSAVADPQRQEDAQLVGSDEWEAKSVEIFDSVSVVACDMYRKKIDKWQEIAGRWREGEAEGRLPGNVRRNPRRRCRGTR
ncbi:MAG: hypothetical protein ALECFALPRED_009883 [Alectoria fallacina]|uniref:Uncharacterized protein n=1 Tax=Alectoria fallacina TaxID=1903189 RepID=A0A8H3PJ64_9LECA|nr:MAG: hypothetical protein ALECFALPRED_009883 [Alectoria fallacina]